MSNLKDKLSANVRRAKATQLSEHPPAEQLASNKPTTTKPTAPRAAAKPATQSAAVRTRARKPSAAKPAAQPAAAPQGTQRSANFVEESGSALFPARVWPD